MSDKRLLCLGYGYVARRLARDLTAKGWRIAGTLRGAAKAALLEDDGVEPVLWAGGVLGPHAFDRTTAILISTPPDEGGCPALAAAQIAIAERASELSWIGYLSTNGVYGDHGGAWVDETSPLKATSARAKNRINAERQWAEFAEAHGLPLVIFRLPGIYGPGRSALDAVREGRAQRIVKEGQTFSRAHVDDIAAALHASLENPAAGGLFNIADDEPAPQHAVVEFASALLGVPPPPLVPLEKANLSDMARSFYDDNKRVSNALMKARLSPALKFPTYREGLRAVFEDERAPIPIQD
ncbi:MAG: SDR family oxidoreductase [Pseudomonadota bacterium]